MAACSAAVARAYGAMRTVTAGDAARSLPHRASQTPTPGWGCQQAEAAHLYAVEAERKPSADGNACGRREV